MVDDDDQVTNELRVRHQHVVEGVAELQDQRLALVEVIGLLQLLVVEHPEQKRGFRNTRANLDA